MLRLPIVRLVILHLRRKRTYKRIAPVRPNLKVGKDMEANNKKVAC